MNKVILMGRLTKAPEIKDLQDDNKTAMARYTLAVERRYGKDREREADFIPCVTFGKNAEFAEIYLKKGTKIVISGRIRTGSYTDSEGVKRYSSNVVVEEHFFAESKKASDTDPKDEKDGFMSVPEDAELPFKQTEMSEIQIDGPLQCIVSDMTAFWVKGIYYELTLYMDLWNNEILSHSLSSKRGDRTTYISDLENLLEIKKQHPEYQMILHSDQGSVYASKAYNDLLPMYVVRSMPRAGTPTDNSAMESINGWITAELFMDFHVTGERPVYEEVNEYIKFFNEERPAYALSYLTPKQYRERYAA